MSKAINSGDEALEEPTKDVMNNSSDEEDETTGDQRDALSTNHVVAYSIGHFNNDLCASMWFIYLTWYVANIVELSDTMVGLCLLSGQITDGFTTPIVGLLSDKINCPGGRRNFWYYFGFSFVNLAFLGIFTNPKFLQSNQTLQNVWYLVMPAIFNIGWASVQIAHMSIVNKLTYSQRKRDRLVNYRNGLTYTASVVILTEALFVFIFVSNGDTQFTILCLSAIIIGCCTSSFYIYFIRENTLGPMALELESKFKNLPIDSTGMALVNEDEGTRMQKTWRYWVAQPQFWLMGTVYMMARIAYNCLATIWPFYLQYVCLFTTDDPLTDPTSPQLAIVPLVNYCSSMLFSIFLQAWFTQALQSRVKPIMVAALMIICGSLPLAFLSPENTFNSWSAKWIVYPCASVQGVGTAILLNTSTSIISDVIGQDQSSSAFVYGVYSFMDKVANGFLISWLVAAYSHEAKALRIIIVTVPILAVTCALISTYIATSMFSDRMAKFSLGSKLKMSDAHKRLIAEEDDKSHDSVRPGQTVETPYED